MTPSDPSEFEYEAESSLPSGRSLSDDEYEVEVLLYRIEIAKSQIDEIADLRMAVRHGRAIVLLVVFTLLMSTSLIGVIYAQSLVHRDVTWPFYAFFKGLIFAPTIPIVLVIAFLFLSVTLLTAVSQSQRNTARLKRAEDRLEYALKRAADVLDAAPERPSTRARKRKRPSEEPVRKPA